MSEYCSICGQGVKFGSGNYINRVPDLNDVETRKAMGRKYPEGDFVCAKCDEETN